MNADEPETPEEQFSSDLAAFDDAPAERLLRQGLRPPAPPAPPPPALPDAPPPAGASGGAPWPRLGRFEIRRELGQGGFGVVFLAYDPLLGREVALKVPRPEALLTPELC